MDATGRLAAATVADSGETDARLRPIGQWRLVWRRFTRHRMAVVGGCLLLAIVMLAVVGPLIAPPFTAPNTLTGQIPLSVLKRANQPPQLSWPYIVGTDWNGDPAVTYLLVGGGPLLELGIVGALLACLLGVVIGGLAGYLRGVVDVFLMRVVDALLAVPFLLFVALATRYVTDRSIPTYILLFGLLGWPGTARLVRGYVLSLRERDYAVAARALGVSPWGIIGRHLLPNALDVIVVSLTLNVAIFIITAVNLEAVGAGLLSTTWASPLLSASPLGGSWWLLLFPSLMLVLTVLAVNLLGDGLRDALDVTSPTAMSDVARERGVVGQAAAAMAGQVTRIAQPAGRIVSGVAKMRMGTVGIGPRVRRGRLNLSGSPREWVGGALPRDRGAGMIVAAPLVVRVAPIVAVYLLIGAAFLYGHSPLLYSPHYPTPAPVASTYGRAPYAAWPRRQGGWDIFAVGPGGRLAYQRVDGQGRTVTWRSFGPGDATSQPSMDRGGGRLLGAWAADQGQTIDIAFLGAGHRRVRALTPPGGIAEHPDVVALRHGFGILFDWQKPKGSTFDIYLATIAGPSARAHVIRLVRSGDYAFYPRGILDGSGALNVLYFRRVAPSIWHLLRQRFTPAGKPLGRAGMLGTVTYTGITPNGCTNPNVEPDQWAIDLKRAADGSIWAAWEDGKDCVGPGGVSGANTLYLGHWSHDGRVLLPRTVVDPAADANAAAVALALQGRGGHLYQPVPAEPQPYIEDIAFSADGRLRPAERMDYDGGGTVSNPEARSVQGRPVVIWEKNRLYHSVFVTTTYHPAQPPDLLTRFGLNIGNVWRSLGVVIFGSLALGIGLALVNVFLLLPLIPVWLVVRRFSPRLRWPVFFTALGLLLAWVFGLPSTLPGYVLAIGGLIATPPGPLYRWIAVTAGLAVGIWSERFVFGREESSVRAVLAALSALFIIAAMYGVLFAQAQINQI